MGIRTPDLLHAMGNAGVHLSPSAGLRRTVRLNGAGSTPGTTVRTRSKDLEAAGNHMITSRSTAEIVGGVPEDVDPASRPAGREDDALAAHGGCQATQQVRLDPRPRVGNVDDPVAGPIGSSASRRPAPGRCRTERGAPASRTTGP